MDFLKDFFEAAIKVITIITSSSSTAALSAVGAILLLLTAVLAYVALKTSPEKISKLVWISLFASLLGGMAFSAAGPGLALFYLAENAIKRMDPDLALKHLEDNLRVVYLVRLVSYDPVSDPASRSTARKSGPKNKFTPSLRAMMNSLGTQPVRPLRKLAASTDPTIEWRRLSSLA